MEEFLLRFLIGGAVVSAFAVLGDLFKPKSFAGIFGAAPSVALATLVLTVSTEGTSYVATEARSMVAGAVAFFIYASCASWLLVRYKFPSLATTSLVILVWLAAGMSGTQRARNAAGVDAAGAAIGTIGLLCFAVLVWQLITSYQTWIVLTAATFAWLTVSVLIWHLRT